MKLWVVIEENTFFPYFSEERAKEMASEDSIIQEIEVSDPSELEKIFELQKHFLLKTNR